MNQPIGMDAACEKARLTPHINVKMQRPGTKIVVWTQNSVYELTVTDPVLGRVWLNGPCGEFEEVYLSGSTWGGHLLWTGRIGYRMHLEFAFGGGRVVRTSPVRAARLEGDGWKYEMNWGD